MGDPSYAGEIRQAEQLRRSGNIWMAVNLLREVLEKDGDHFAANYSLGMLYHHSGQNELSIPFLEKALEQQPDNFTTLINLGIIQHEEDMLAAAQINLENAVSIQPGNPIAHVTLGMLLMDRNDLDGALSELELGLQLGPRDAMTLERLGMLMQVRGEPDKAAVYYRKVIAMKPLDGAVHRSLALVRRQTRYNDDITRMEHAIHNPETSKHDRVLLAYALGKVFDDLAQHDKAFEYLHSANQQHRRSYQYSIEDQKLFFERHKAGLDGNLVDHCKNHQINDATPIFVLGMPRSGTSLVEQILASHPLAHGAGEVDYSRFFVDAVETITQKPFPLDIAKVPARELEKTGLAYIEKLRLNADSAERAIDKLPHNFLRIGLFAAVLPEAKIVLCERDPMDNCLSVYQNFFGKEHGYAANLTELGQYYALYQDLMEWWENMLPGHIYRVSYEHLVSDFDGQLRQLLQFCDLPFAEECLSFHQTRRPVKTPSASQVQQAIYQNSIGRWKNYEQQLHPLRQALGSVGSE